MLVEVEKLNKSSLYASEEIADRLQTFTLEDPEQDHAESPVISTHIELLNGATINCTIIEISCNPLECMLKFDPADAFAMIESRPAFVCIKHGEKKVYAKVENDATCKVSFSRAASFVSIYQQRR